MFLWWRITKKDEPEPEELEKEIEELKAELQTSALTRPSNVSKGKYNKWLVAEDNKGIGGAVRQEVQELATQREETRNEFLEQGHERAQNARDQREAAAERVKQHKKAMQEKGKQVVAEMNKGRTTARERRDEYQQHATRINQQYGAEQRERLHESIAAKEERRREAAQNVKQAMIDRAEAYQDMTQRQMEEKRERVARIREETNGHGFVEGKKHFQNVNQRNASDVRESIGEWMREKEANKRTVLMEARLKRFEAQEAFKRAVDGKKILEEKRKQDAGEMREGLRMCQLHKEQMKLSAEFQRRERHDDAFETGFVAPEQAITVEISAYETIATTHRTELSHRDMTQSRAPSGGNWIQQFQRVDGGFFTNWFGGSG